MSGADGQEERTAEADERHDVAERDIEVSELLADEARSAAFTDGERIQELKALLRNIELGAEGMLQPALGLRGSLLGYVTEVRRVARAGRSV